MNKVLILLLSLTMLSGCYDSDNAIKAIQLNTKDCFSKAITEEDKTLCLEEAKSYRETCFNKNGGGSFSLACMKLINKWIE